MSGSPPIARLIRISGRVQGVGYRAWAEREAKARGLAGWVRNRRDGTVEALFSGSEDVVAAMIEACWKGPRLSEVSAVRVGAVEATSLICDFQQRPTE